MGSAIRVLFVLVTGVCCATAVAGSLPGLSGTLDSLAAGISTRLVAAGAHRVAVAGFTDLMGQTLARHVFLAEALTDRLVNHSALEVIDRASLEPYEDADMMPAAAFLRPDVSVSLSQRLRLEYIIAGTVAESESTLVLSVRAISLKTGVIAAFVSASAGSDALLDGLSDAGTVSPRWVAGALRVEGESLRAKHVTAGTFELQQWNDERWSGRNQAWWWGAKPGDRLDLLLRTPRGRFRVTAQFCKAFDYGTTQLLLDGKKLGSPMDFYDEGVTVSGPVDLGVHTFGPGQHILSAVITGANPKMHLRGSDATKQFLFAIDYLDFQKEMPGQ